MGIVQTLIVGLAVGILARVLMPRRDPSGLVITIVLAVAGAFLAAWVGRAVGLHSPTIGGPGLVASVLGATLFLLFHRLVARRRVLGE